jgi:hypothetical protein
MNGAAADIATHKTTRSSTTAARLIPITLRDAAAFVADHHRHLGPPRGHRFSIAAAARDQLVGVVIVGRPVARMLDDGLTAEVTRLCTTGHPNTCSLLLGAAWRAARAMGYERMVSYTRDDEPGTSLKAAGWQHVATRPARPGWHTPARPRTGNGVDQVARTLWMVTTGGERR